MQSTCSSILRPTHSLDVSVSGSHHDSVVPDCSVLGQTQVRSVKLSAFFVNADSFQYADASSTYFSITRWSVVSDHHCRKTPVYIVMLFQIVLYDQSPMFI